MTTPSKWTPEEIQNRKELDTYFVDVISPRHAEFQTEYDMIVLARDYQHQSATNQYGNAAYHARIARRKINNAFLLEWLNKYIAMCEYHTITY